MQLEVNAPLNATLIIQIINFFVAYCLLRFGLFGPLIRAIRRYYEEQYYLQSTLEQIKQELDHMKKQHQLKWREFQLSVQTSNQVPRAHEELSPTPFLTQPSIVPYDSPQIIDTLAHLMVQKIKSEQ